MQLTFSTYAGFYAVTPSDTDLVNCRAIYVGGAGNIAIATGITSTPVVFTAVNVGDILPIQLDAGRIMAASTTATLLVALQ